MKKTIFILLLTLCILTSCNFDPNGLIYSATHGEKPVGSTISYIANVDDNGSVLVFTDLGIYNIKKDQYNSEKAYSPENRKYEYANINGFKKDGNNIIFINPNDGKKLITIDLATLDKTESKNTNTILQFLNNNELIEKNNEIVFNGKTWKKDPKPYYIYQSKFDNTKYTFFTKDKKIYDQDNKELITLKDNQELAFSEYINSSWYFGIKTKENIEICMLKDGKLENKGTVLANSLLAVNCKECFSMMFNNKLYFQETNMEKFTSIDNTGLITTSIDPYKEFNINKETSLAGVELTTYFVKNNDLYLGTAKQGIIKCSIPK